MRFASISDVPSSLIWKPMIATVPSWSIAAMIVCGWAGSQANDCTGRSRALVGWVSPPVSRSRNVKTH